MLSREVKLVCGGVFYVCSCVCCAAQIAGVCLSLAIIATGWTFNIIHGWWGHKEFPFRLPRTDIKHYKDTRMEQEATENGRLYRQFNFVLRQIRVYLSSRIYREIYFMHGSHLLQCLAGAEVLRYAYRWHQSNAMIRGGYMILNWTNMYDSGAARRAFNYW